MGESWVTNGTEFPVGPSDERGTLNRWVFMDPDDPALQPVYDQPPCPGVGTHPWRLTIEQGQMTLGSGCQECDEGVLCPMGGEDVEMYVEVVGTLKSHLEVSGWETPEYHHWWEFVPTHFASRTDQP